ncbi:MAG TPA: DUF3943 domain-containing protein, partial [Pontiella sp.]
ERLWSQTKAVSFYGLGVIGVILALPDKHTGWEKDPAIFNKWVENISEGPEWDRNNWIYNYPGHIYFGGVYYQVARKSGYRQWDSFIYSALMSTFYWEYGVEAFAEVPSVQDLVITPVLGWVYGEWAYQTEIKIREQNNTVLGSKILGNTSLFLLDPIDTIGQGLNRIVGHKLVRSGYSYFTYTVIPNSPSADHQLMLNLYLPIGGQSFKEPINPPIYSINKQDPIDTRIVGIDLGSGYTILDNDWNLNSGKLTSISVGLYFTPRISSRLSYIWGNVYEKTDNRSVDYENYNFGIQCYLNTKRTIRPYLNIGFGEQLFSGDNGPKTFQWTTGPGLHWKIHSKWALHAQWNNYYSPSREMYDQTFSMGLIYRFGYGDQEE